MHKARKQCVAVDTCGAKTYVGGYRTKGEYGDAWDVKEALKGQKPEKAVFRLYLLQGILGGTADVDFPDILPGWCSGLCLIWTHIGGVESIVFGPIRWCVWSFRPSSPCGCRTLLICLFVCLLTMCGGPSNLLEVAEPQDFCIAGGAQQEVMYGEAPGMVMTAPVGSGARLYGAAAAGPTAVPGGAARAAGWVPLGGEMGQVPSGSRGLVSKPPGVQLGGLPGSGAMAAGSLVQFMDPSGQVYYLSQGAS